MTARRNILVVAAHPDDEVLGCGATMARLAGEGHAVHVLILADGESSRIRTDMRAAADLVGERNAAAAEANRILRTASVTIHQLPDNQMDSVPLLDVVRLVEAAVARCQPDTVFTHHAGDVNVDHRVVHEAVLAACRPVPGHPVRNLYFFEVPSSTEWRPPGSATDFAPSVFVDVSAVLAQKLEALGAYRAELREFPHPRSLRAVEALARWRGATAGVEAAEAFVAGRQVIEGTRQP
jgi:LmbE family N-acetylglucosaminyl deacetylase